MGSVMSRRQGYERLVEEIEEDFMSPQDREALDRRDSELMESTIRKIMYALHDYVREKIIIDAKRCTLQEGRGASSSTESEIDDQGEPLINE